MPQGLKPRIDSAGSRPGIDPWPAAPTSLIASGEFVPFQNQIETDLPKVVEVHWGHSDYQYCQARARSQLGA